MRVGYSIIYSLLLSCSVSQYVIGQTPRDDLFQSVSSTTLDEQELSALLDQVRQVRNTRLASLPLGAYKGYLLEDLERLVQSHLRSGQEDAVSVIKDLDNALTERYEKEASLLEDALKHPWVNVNTRDEEGRTPLYLAVLNNKPSEILVPLLAAGADIYATDKKGVTPEHLAAAQCQADRDLSIKLNPGKSWRAWGIADNIRSCWTQKTLASERRQAQGGVRKLYDWLMRAKTYVPDVEREDILEGILSGWND